MKPQTKANPPRPHKAAPPKAKPRVVLIADDDADWRLLVRDVLQQHAPPSIQVLEAGDGLEALRILMRQGEHADAPQPDLVYMDCEMPRLGGTEVLEAIRACPRIHDVPIVMLTGVNDEARMRRACELGAAGYILKPPTIKELKRVITASAGHWLRAAGCGAPAGGEAGSFERAA